MRILRPVIYFLYIPPFNYIFLSFIVDCVIMCSHQLITSIQRRSDTPTLSACPLTSIHISLSAFWTSILQSHTPLVSAQSLQTYQPPQPTSHSGVRSYPNTKGLDSTWDSSCCCSGQTAVHDKSPEESERQRLFIKMFFITDNLLYKTLIFSTILFSSSDSWGDCVSTLVLTNNNQR